MLRGSGTSYFRGNTALHASIVGNHGQVIDYLSSVSGIQIEKMNSNGYTALHLSCIIGHFEATKSLIRAQADVNNIVTRDHHTPLTLACQYGFLDIVDALIAAGADVNHATLASKTPITYAAEFTCRQERKANLQRQSYLYICSNTIGSRILNLLLAAEGRADGLEGLTVGDDEGAEEGAVGTDEGPAVGGAV